MYSGRWKPGFPRNMQPLFSGQKSRLTYHQATLYHDIYVHNNNITATKVSIFFLYMSHIMQFRALDDLGWLLSHVSVRKKVKIISFRVNTKFGIVLRKLF
jgi:hypothetical protein